MIKVRLIKTAVLACEAIIAGISVSMERVMINNKRIGKKIPNIYTNGLPSKFRISYTKSRLLNFLLFTVIATSLHGVYPFLFLCFLIGCFGIDVHHFDITVAALESHIVMDQ